MTGAPRAILGSALRARRGGTSRSTPRATRVAPATGFFQNLPGNHLLLLPRMLHWVMMVVRAGKEGVEGSERNIIGFAQVE